MKKVALAWIAGLIAAGIGIPNAGAGGGDGKTYWLGTGDKRDSRVEFIVNDGKVRDLLMLTSETRCSGGGRVSLGRSWDPIRLDGNAFRDRQASGRGAKAFVAGHVRGQKAAGRMSAKGQWFDEFCDSDIERWKAEQVTHEEWQDAHSQSNR